MAKQSNLTIPRLVLQGLRKPRTIGWALKNPSLTFKVLAKFRYECNQSDFVARLADTSTANVSRIYSELKSNDSLYEHLDKCWNRCQEIPSTKTTGEVRYDIAEILYALIRVMSPDVVVETGVAQGISSTFILQALADNKRGQLHSIDLPPTGHKLADDRVYFLPQNEQSGWMVPQKLRSRWHLILGKSSDELGPLLEELGTINCFFHDSLHTYENMKAEYEVAWPFINTILLSHDILDNSAFFEFCRDTNGTICTYNYFGGIRKK